MSYLRKVATLQKQDPDRAKAVTISLPASLSARVEEIIQETGLSRSGVYQALIKDGLVEYLNAPIQDFLEAVDEALQVTDDFFLPSEIFPPEEHITPYSAGEVHAICKAKMESNRKLVWG